MHFFRRLRPRRSLFSSEAFLPEKCTCYLQSGDIIYNDIIKIITKFTKGYVIKCCTENSASTQSKEIVIKNYVQFTFRKKKWYHNRWSDHNIGEFFSYIIDDEYVTNHRIRMKCRWIYGKWVRIFCYVCCLNRHKSDSFWGYDRYRNKWLELGNLCCFGCTTQPYNMRLLRDTFLKCGLSLENSKDTNNTLFLLLDVMDGNNDPLFWCTNKYNGNNVLLKTPEKKMVLTRIKCGSIDCVYQLCWSCRQKLFI